MFYDHISRMNKSQVTCHKNFGSSPVPVLCLFSMLSFRYAPRYLVSKTNQTFLFGIVFIIIIMTRMSAQITKLY